MSKSFYVSLSAFAALLLSVTANGATIYQNVTDDSKGKEHLTKWDNGQALSSENDYVSDNSMTIRAPSDGSTVTFSGHSLRLGTANGKGTTFVPYGGTYIFNNGGLILEKGMVIPYVSSKKNYFNGLVKVTAPNSDPFVFLPAQNANKDNYIYLSAKIDGSKESGFRVANRGDSSQNAKLYLDPASGSDFAGTFTIGPATTGQSGAYDKDKQPIYVGLIGDSVVWPGAIDVTQYGQLVPDKSSTKWTVGALNLRPGSTFQAQLGELTTSTMTLTNSLTTTGSVNLTFPSARTVNMNKGYVWDILTLPKEKSSMIHPEHFKLVTQEAVGMFPDVFPSVALRVTKKNDLSVLELVQRRVVQNRFADDPLGYSCKEQGFEFPTSMTNALAWTNEELPSSDIDYIAAYHLNAAPPSQCDEGAYTFPGASLTLSNGVVFSEAAHCFTIPMLRVMEDSQFWPIADTWEDQTAEVQGRIHAIPGGGTSGDKAALIRVRENTTARICAEITGEGRIQVQPNGPDKEGCHVVFDNDNSKFLGKIRITANNASVSDFKYGENLILKAANNAGGPLEGFTADALEIRRYSTLEVTNDVVFATANRGLTVNNARIKVGAGATFTFANDIMYAGPLTKVGAGRLVLGGSALGSKKALTVEEGTLAVSTDTALDGVAVTFTGGGALAVNPATAGQYGMRGLFSGNLPVAFDLPADEEPYEYSNIAVCTVADSADVTPKAVRIPRHRVVFHWQDNGDGTKTLLADISRTGAAIILR